MLGDVELSTLVQAIKEAKKRNVEFKDDCEEQAYHAKLESIEASNAIENIKTTKTNIKQLVAKKKLPESKFEQEIAGYQDVLEVIIENHDMIPVNKTIFFSYIKFSIAIRIMPLVEKQRMFRTISVQPILMVMQKFVLLR